MATLLQALCQLFALQDTHAHCFGSVNEQATALQVLDSLLNCLLQVSLHVELLPAAAMW